jgi:transcriptional regulator with XRE-family HTH domain
MSGKVTTFGDFIRERRLAKGLSLRRFAQLIRLSPTYVSQIETGAEPPPTADRARKIAEVLGEPEDVVVLLAGRMPDGIPEILQERPEELAALIREAGKLTGPQIEKLTEEARRLKKRKKQSPK